MTMLYISVIVSAFVKECNVNNLNFDANVVYGF